MKPKYLIITFFIFFALSLSACAGGTTTATSWPGLTVDAEAAYVAYNTHVYSVELSNGNLRWQFPAEADNQITFYGKPALTPDGQLIVGSYNNVLYSLDPENGTENWRFAGAKNRFIAGPLATEEAIFAPNADEKVYALDFNLNILWTFEMTAESWARPLHNPECSCIYVSSMDHTIYALSTEDGAEIWRSEDLGGAIVGTPALSEDGILYVGTFGSEVLALDSKNGQVLWRSPAEGWIWSGPTLHEDRLYLGDLNGNFYAVDATNGDNVWQLSSERLDGPISGSPLVLEDIIYFTTESGTVFAVTTDGDIEWSQPVGGKLYTHPDSLGDMILVTPIDTDELVIALTRDGAKRWGFNPNPE